MKRKTTWRGVVVKVSAPGEAAAIARSMTIVRRLEHEKMEI
jgi:hypothetical protein